MIVQLVRARTRARCVVLGLILCLAGCSEPPPPTAVTQSPAAQPAADGQAPDLPGGFGPLWKTATAVGAAGMSGGFAYTWAREGDRAVALMRPRPLPRDDDIVVGAIVDLARRAFSVDLSSATPRVEARPEGSAILLDSGATQYLTLLIKSETDEGAYQAGLPHTLLMWRE